MSSNNGNNLRLEDIEVVGGSGSRGKSPDKITLEPPGGNQQVKKEERRGSNLLSAAGINYETRRRNSQFDEKKTFQEGNQVVVEDKDGNITKMEILEVREKLGTFRRSVPTLPICIAILLCGLNCIIPGTGTLIGAACLLCCGKCRLENSSLGIKYGVICAVLQLITAPILLGWIWSILWGVYFLQDSVTKAAMVQPENEDETGGEKKPPSEGNKTQAWA